MFLDEPTTGLDPLARQKVWNIVRRLMQQGTTVLLTTQYLEEADVLADRIVVIDKGRVVTEGSPASLKRRVGAERAELTFTDAATLSAARDLLADAAAVCNLMATRLTIGVDDPWRLHDILDRLRRTNLKPLSVTVAQPTLDDVFLALTTSGTGQARKTT